MIEFLPPDRANRAFSIGVLSGRSRCRWSVAIAHRTKPSDLCIVINAIANDIVRSGLSAASLRHLPSKPISCRVCRRPSHMIRRRRCREIRNPYGSRKESVGTTNRSIEATSSARLQRKVLQPCDGPRLLRAMYFAMLVWPTSMPSLSKSPGMQGAPRSGLIGFMSRITLRISSGTLGPPPRRLDFQRRNDRDPARCR
jgi:hypothetical protein